MDRPARDQKVREFFSDTEVYLKDNFVTSLRRDVLREMTQGQVYRRVIDVACGNGGVTLPLIRRMEHLTLLDLSPAMLAEARKALPQDPGSQVSFVQGDLMRIDLPVMRGNNLREEARNGAAERIRPYETVEQKAQCPFSKHLLAFIQVAFVGKHSTGPDQIAVTIHFHTALQFLNTAVTGMCFRNIERQ